MDFGRSVINCIYKCTSLYIYIDTVELFEKDLNQWIARIGYKVSPSVLKELNVHIAEVMKTHANTGSGDKEGLTVADMVGECYMFVIMFCLYIYYKNTV
mgnify:CR=1 FL=1